MGEQDEKRQALRDARDNERKRAGGVAAAVVEVAVEAASPETGPCAGNSLRQSAASNERPEQLGVALRAFRGQQPER
ncbi:MAG: hypothetical protein Q8O67_13690 [Deltaproteobacteria bacterium]|nr:hypothetical protein [Deltaproteobacteria bacterium]